MSYSVVFGSWLFSLNGACSAAVADAGMAVQAVGRVFAGQMTDFAGQIAVAIDAVVGGHGAVAAAGPLRRGPPSLGAIWELNPFNQFGKLRCYRNTYRTYLFFIS